MLFLKRIVKFIYLFEIFETYFKKSFLVVFCIKVHLRTNRRISHFLKHSWGNLNRAIETYWIDFSTNLAFKFHRTSSKSEKIKTERKTTGYLQYFVVCKNSKVFCNKNFISNFQVSFFQKGNCTKSHVYVRFSLYFLECFIFPLVFHISSYNEIKTSKRKVLM